MTRENIILIIYVPSGVASSIGFYLVFREIVPFDMHWFNAGVLGISIAVSQYFAYRWYRSQIEQRSLLRRQ
jgi:hypothetical protein